MCTPALLRRLAADRGGGVAVMLALLLPVLVGVASLAIETGLWFAERRALQNAVDAAALSGAFELTAGRKTTVLASALADGRKNAADANFTIRNPPASGKYVGNTSAVEAVATRPQSLMLSALFLGDMTVRARAVARVGHLGDPCILALERVESSTAEFTGSADIVLKDCGVKANSSSAQALTVSGSSSLTAKFVETVGGYEVSGSGKLTVDNAITNASATEDPLKNIANPAVGGCAHSNYKQNGTATLSPGVYCNGLDLGAQAKVTLSPGVYVVNGGSVKINGGAQVSGTSVTIFLTGTSGNYAQIDINGGAQVNLTAPNSGTYAGVLFFQDRNAPAGGDNKFNGGSTMSLNGALYFPGQQVDFQGNTANSGGCTRIVADTVTFTGDAALGNACASLGLASAGATPPRLVE
jgi:hypothetical protein